MCPKKILICFWLTSGFKSRITMTLLEIFNFEQSFSTRKYKKTHLHHYRSPMKKLKAQEEKSAPQENNKVIEDPKIRSRPQTGAQISINTGLAHFIQTGKKLSFLQCAQGSCNCSCGNFTISRFLVLLDIGPHLGKMLDLENLFLVFILTILLRCQVSEMIALGRIFFVWYFGY